MSRITAATNATPAAPSSGSATLFWKSDGLQYWIDDGGIEHKAVWASTVGQVDLAGTGSDHALLSVEATQSGGTFVSGIFAAATCPVVSGQAYGGDFQAFATGAGTRDVLVAANTVVGHQGTGTLNFAAGAQLSANTNTGGGTITNNYGLYVWDQTAGTTNYNIWSGPENSAFSSALSSNGWLPTIQKNVFTNASGYAMIVVSEDDASNSAISAIASITASGGISVGVDGDGIISGTATGTAYGTSGNAYSYGTCNPAGLIALYSYADHGSSGVAARMVGALIEANANTGGGTITNNYGVKVEDQTAGTNNFNIYSGVDMTSLSAATQASWPTSVLPKHVFVSQNSARYYGSIFLHETNDVVGGSALTAECSATADGVGAEGLEGYGTAAAASGTVPYAVGVLGIAVARLGNVAELDGGSFAAYNVGSGIVDLAVGLDVAPAINIGGGTIGAAIGLRIRDQSVGGSNFAILTQGLAITQLGGNLLVAGETPTPILTIGGAPIVNGGGYIKMVSSNTAYNWQISTNGIATAGAFELTPSTAAGGGTFTTPLFRITSAGALTWGAYGAGALTTDASGNITAVSDLSVKRDVRPFTRGIESLRGISPILHGYTPESGLDQTRDDYAGFSAQNVRDNMPEAVGQMADGKLTLNDRPILAAAVNALIEMDKELQQLKGKQR